jgi:hypothetical protein
LQNDTATNYDEFISVVGLFTRKLAFSPKTDQENLPFITPDPIGMPSAYGLYLPRVLTPDYYLYPYAYPFPSFSIPLIAGVGP